MDTTQPSRTAISIVVTRADGTVEDLGVVDFQSRNPLEHAAYVVKKALGQIVSLPEVFTPDSKKDTE